MHRVEELIDFCVAFLLNECIHQISNSITSQSTHHSNNPFFFLCSQNLSSPISTAELCALSEYRIYPGNGRLYIRRDGKPIFMGSSKAYSLTIQRKKPAKLVWTQAWRRLHKKGMSETTTKKRTRRLNKVQRSVVGISLDDIK